METNAIFYISYYVLSTCINPRITLRTQTGDYDNLSGEYITLGYDSVNPVIIRSCGYNNELFCQLNNDTCDIPINTNQCSINASCPYEYQTSQLPLNYSVFPAGSYQLFSVINAFGVTPNHQCLNTMNIFITLTCGTGITRMYPFEPTQSPTYITSTPTINPTTSPTYNPTEYPSLSPTKTPTNNPTNIPSETPTTNPTDYPSTFPTVTPTLSPTITPTTSPTFMPTIPPTNTPTNNPSELPTNNPTFSPSISPTKSSSNPTITPSLIPSFNPTKIPSKSPSIPPTTAPSPKPSIPPTITALALNAKSGFLSGLTVTERTLLILLILCLIGFCIICGLIALYFARRNNKIMNELNYANHGIASQSLPHSMNNDRITKMERVNTHDNNGEIQTNDTNGNISSNNNHVNSELSELVNENPELKADEIFNE